MRSPKNAAKSFKKQFSINDVTEEALIAAINRQGYTVIYFNAIYNDHDVATLVDALNLENYISTQKGFTYENDKYRLVFINEDLTKEEKVLVLAHEEGHIFNGHCSNCNVIGRDVQQEHEANEFAHYLLYPTFCDKINQCISKHKKTVGIVALCILVAITGIIAFSVISREKSYFGEYYLTSTGNKYHKGECIFVKDKTNVRRMKIEEFESGEYEPCGTCLPQG